MLISRSVGYSRAEKWCKGRDFVGVAFHADHRRTVDVQRGAHRRGQPRRVADLYRRQLGEHRGQTRPEVAGRKPVIAVEVVVVKLLSGYAHGLGVVVE